MFKKLKEKIEAGEEGNLDKISTSPRRPPGVAVRSPLAENETLSFDDNIVPTTIIQNNEILNGNDQTDSKQSKIEEQNDEEVISEEDSHQQTNVTDLQLILSQLSNDLGILRNEYDDLVKVKETSEEELRTEVIQLETQLEQKNVQQKIMETKISELTWSVESLTSRLQLYSSYDENQTIKRLQKEVSELERSLRERNFEIEILETRLSAQSKQKHDEQAVDIKKIYKLQEKVTSFQTSVLEKDAKLVDLSGMLKMLQKQLSDVDRKREQLDVYVDEQKNRIEEQQKELLEQASNYSLQIQERSLEHEKAMEDLKQQLQDVQSQLKDKEQQLERVVNELPDEPVTRAVLEGFSRTSMVDTFSNKLHAPGVVFRRDANPLVGYVCEDDNERELESPPAILPVENHVDMATTSMDLTAFYQNQIQELKIENEQLEEDLIDKNKTIRIQQQKISDMKKALSKGFKTQESIEPPKPPPMLLKNTGPLPTHRLAIASDVNFQYLKNVVVRFICSREDEACQLVRAISTLLELSTEEEKYIQDYLQYKMSWFGSMPVPPNTPIKHTT